MLAAFAILAMKVEAQPSASKGGRIATEAGGRLQFSQRGTQLVIPDDRATATRAVELPGKWIIESVVQEGPTVWVSGRSNAPEIDDMFVAIVGDEGNIDLLPTPPDRHGPRRRSRLLRNRGRIVGITWLEGSTQETTSVRASSWNGGQWSDVEIISPPRNKEQTALNAVALNDGSWLAIWAAVDSDDDLWWSRRTRRGWSEPARLHVDNDVPDIHPHVIATAAGAFATWSWFDGADYRLRTARFDGESWFQVELASDRGSVAAKLVDLDGDFGLLYNSVVPDAWSLVWLDGSTRELSRWRILTAEPTHPLLWASGSTLSLEWPHSSGQAASGQAAMRRFEP